MNFISISSNATKALDTFYPDLFSSWSLCFNHFWLGFHFFFKNNRWNNVLRIKILGSIFNIRQVPENFQNDSTNTFSVNKLFKKLLLVISSSNLLEIVLNFM